jgi:hypothetical protein
MKLLRDAVLSTTAVVTETPTRWLATSAHGSPIRIGTAGASRAQAEQNFAAEIKAWAALAEKPD